MTAPVSPAPMRNSEQRTSFSYPADGQCTCYLEGVMLITNSSIMHTLWMNVTWAHHNAVNISLPTSSGQPIQLNIGLDGSGTCSLCIHINITGVS